MNNYREEGRVDVIIVWLLTSDNMQCTSSAFTFYPLVLRRTAAAILLHSSILTGTNLRHAKNCSVDHVFLLWTDLSVVGDG